MKLYTKTGDDGDTGLIGGDRVRKDDPRVATYGDVDETNAAIGAAIAACRDDELAERLRQIQSDLFSIGTALATPDDGNATKAIAQARIQQLEAWIDAATAEVEPLTSFVLPGGSATAAALHLARAICRRAERAVVSLSHDQAVDTSVLVYLNRLSDLLFAAARLANHREGVAETRWPSS